jgi:hypothetical protein
MNLGDFLRMGTCTLDELYIEGTGRSLIHVGSNQQLRGFYEVPFNPDSNSFGLDAPDQMEIELGFRMTLKKIGSLPAIGDLIYLPQHQSNWKITAKRQNDDAFRGLNRLILTVARYQESTTNGDTNEQCHQGTI